GSAPLQRWTEGIPDPLPLPSPQQLREAFLWSEFRTVNKNAFVSLHNNRYRVDEMLIGRKIELVFDPFNLDELEVRYRGRSHGKAVAFEVGRHVHPKARPDTGSDQHGGAEPSGIDYLKLLDDAHTEKLESRINYTALFNDDTGDGNDGDSGDEDPGLFEVVAR
ncbi:MAG: transposase, partial [Actinophytocola sp.]|nr:transposase [Actinophytocola sp.]